MARKERRDVRQQGRGEIIGMILIAAALFLFLALFSYDRHDLDLNRVPPNPAVNNLLGRVGAKAAYGFFFVAGAAAYVVPVILFAFGLAAFVPGLSYLHRNLRCWIGALGFLGACVGLLDLYSKSLGPIRASMESIGAGGYAGYVLNANFTVYWFNRFGATGLYIALYLVSIWLLTDFQIIHGIRDWIARWREARAESAALEEEEAQDSQRAMARELEKKAQRLREELAQTKAERPERTERSERAERAERVERVKPAPAVVANPFAAAPASAPDSANLGPDLQPVPEPTFRDNSMPRLLPSQVVNEGDVIRGSEFVAPPNGSRKPEEPAGRKTRGPAKTSDILGREPKVESPADVVVNAETPAGEPAVTPVDEPASDKTADESMAPLPVRPKPLQRKLKPITVASTPIIGNYQLPAFDLLNPPDLTIKPTETKEELMANSRLMVQTLAQFGIEAAPGDITRGPTITRYELHPAPGVKLERIAALTNNIAAALKAERIHILAPVPGKSSVGIEVPNAVKTKVIFRDLMESREWVETKAKIPLCLGKDVYGQPIIADLAEMPHLLIAGSTGSGKSVCINAIVASLLYKFSPDQLRFVMIDPKVVELQQYNALPHLVVPVVTDPKKVVLALRWVVNEMEKRYQIFARVGVRNIKSFNERPKDKPIEAAQPELPLTARKEHVEAGAEGFAVEVDEQIVVPRDEDIVIPEKLSYIVVIIDELADLMLVAPADVEMAIARITQMARAAGIHCIVATQRPSVDVITGVIKANIPARIAFQVASKVDSRTILDQMGADKLLGKGDMLYLPPGSAKLNRAQGVLITDQEIERVVAHIARQGKPSYESEIHQALQKAPSSIGNMSLDPSEDGDSGDSDLIDKCIEVIRSEKKASVSLLQRRLKLGYGRAARIMDELEDRGIVGPSKGAEPRDVLIDLDGEGYDGGGQHGV